MDRVLLILYEGKKGAYGDNLAYILGAQEVRWIPYTQDWLDSVATLKEEEKAKGNHALLFLPGNEKSKIAAYRERFQDDALTSPAYVSIEELGKLTPWYSYVPVEQGGKVSILFGEYSPQALTALKMRNTFVAPVHDPWMIPHALIRPEEHGFQVQIYARTEDIPRIRPFALRREIIPYDPHSPRSVLISPDLTFDNPILKKEEKQLGTEIAYIYGPEEIATMLEPDAKERKDMDIIVDDPILLPLVRDLGFATAYVHIFSPFKNKSALYVGKDIPAYEAILARFAYKDGGKISPDEKGWEEKVLASDASVIIIDDALLPTFPLLLALREGSDVYPLSAFTRKKIGKCTYAHHAPQSFPIKEGSFACSAFLYDHRNYYPHLRPLLSHPLSEEKGKEWIAAHPPVYKSMAADFLRATQYVSFATFYTQLRRAMQAFQERIGDTPFIILIRSERGLREKSNYWVAHLLWEMLIEAGIPPVDITDSLTYAVHEYPEVRDFVLADDAAYSGTQMHYILRDEIERTLYTLVKQQNAVEMKEVKYLEGAHEIPLCDRNTIPPFWSVHLVIPYMSEEALKVIPIDCRYTCYLTLHTYEQVRMRRLSDILGKERVREMVKAGFIDKDKWPYYFDHKIADYASSYPQKYLYGEVTGTEKHIRFLTNCLWEKTCYDAYYKSIW